MSGINPAPARITRPGDRSRAATFRRATYTLCYDDDALGLPKRIEFEADSPATALEIAGGEADGRQARLFVDGEPLCQLVKASAADAPYWIVAREAKARL